MKAVERVLARSIRQQVNTDRQLGFVEGKGIHWVISHFGLVLRSAEPVSETAVTHRPQGVIIVGIYMTTNIYYLLLLYLIRKVLRRCIGLQTFKRNIFSRLELNVCKPTHLHHSFLL